MSSNVTNEQPMSKRQKIDAADNKNNKKGAFSAIFNGSDNISESNTPPDILPMTNHGHKCTTNGSLNHDDSSRSISSTEVRKSSSESPSDELDNASTCNVFKSIEQKIKLPTENGSHCIDEFPDLLKTSPDVASTSWSHEVLASTTAPGSSNGNSSTNTHETSSRLSSRDSNSFSRLNDVGEFQLHLMKQCLCNIKIESLNEAFYIHTRRNENGGQDKTPLIDWPVHSLIQFLSNMELLFEVYLNQNAKGEICSHVMQVCDRLILKKNCWIIDQIFELSDYNDANSSEAYYSKFVKYLAIKVLANFFLIIKDKKPTCEFFLEKLISSLDPHHDPSDEDALGKVSFILGIILHIMEWKDIKKHPLDDQIVINGREVYNDSDNESYSLPINIPQIQDNYFAVHHGDDETETPLAPTPPAEPPHMVDDHHSREHDPQSNTSQGSNDPRNFSCHLEYLSDSESFDSNNLKVWILGVLRKYKWDNLVQNMAKCVLLLQSNRKLYYIENSVITFLTLWERIISVDTCIEYDSTLPFHKFLETFTDILMEGNLPIQIYKQMLTLFSASLCYTTTLALQPEVPDETNKLANKLFSSVKNSRIFASLPTNEIEPQNNVSFIGYKHSTIIYEISSDQLIIQNDQTDDDDSGDDSDIDLELNEHFNTSIDSTLLQKLVLLVLKAIAVSVRTIGGGDSSDSSMDSSSSISSIVETIEPETEQEWSSIEKATRDAVEKLQNFLRNKLNFHPEAHLSKVIVNLFSNQDDYLLEAMLCMLGTTLAFRPSNAVNRQTNNDRPQLRMLIEMICPVYTFLEFLELIDYGMQTMLDFLLTDETCFLLYFLRFLKYISKDWTMFQNQCNRWQSTSNAMRSNSHSNKQPYKHVMDVLISLRLKLDRLVFQRIFPYEISPLTTLMRQCESLHEGGNYGLF